MNEDGRRKYDDNVAIKIFKDFWPVILAVMSVIVTYSRMDARILALERQSPLYDSHESRITRLETSLINMGEQLKKIDVKLDRIDERLRR